MPRTDPIVGAGIDAFVRRAAPQLQQPRGGGSPLVTWIRGGVEYTATPSVRSYVERMRDEPPWYRHEGD